MKKNLIIVSSVLLTTLFSGCSNPLSNVVFEDVEIIYDGEEHSIEATNIPDGYSVRYENNNQNNAGEYQVEAIFSKDGKDYKKSLYATLIIKPKEVTVTIDNKESMIDSLEELTYSVEGVINNDELNIELEIDNSSSGKKKVEGSWDNDNYNVTFIGGDYLLKEYLFDSSSLVGSSGFSTGYAPFSLYDTSYFSNSVITSISFPYYGLASGYTINSSELYMPIYVVKNDYSTLQSECTIENGKKINLDFTGKLNDVSRGDYLTVEGLNIEVAPDETLAFGDPNMAVLPMYKRNDTNYGFWNKTFGNKGTNNHSLIFKITGYKNDSSLEDNKYVDDDINYISFLGDSISTYEGYANGVNYNSTIGNNAIWYPNTNYTGASLNVEDTWWYQVANQLDYELCVNNSWSGSVVNTSITYNVRARNLHNNSKHAPDIIVVFMGVNDYAANTAIGYYNGTSEPTKTPSNFSQAYGRMIVNIQDEYPDAEIYCCTFLPDRKRFSSNKNGNNITETEYNDAIKTIATNLGVNVIDLYNESGINSNNITTYTVDKLHPNADGMDLITNLIVNKINESQ